MSWIDVCIGQEQTSLQLIGNANDIKKSTNVIKLINIILTTNQLIMVNLCSPEMKTDKHWKLCKIIGHVLRYDKAVLWFAVT